MPDKKVTILVVDDSDLIRYTLTKFFDEYSIEVVNCTDGLDGIKKALEHLPALIFLDLLMPNFDGIKMLQVIKIVEALKNVPVIVISGNANKENVFKAIEAGADRVISKPLQKDTILKNVKEILGENFLGSYKKVGIKEEENREILDKLFKIFMNHYPIKKRKIEKAVETRNRDFLYSLIHEMKGAGGTIGYPVISVTCSEIEKELEVPAPDWSYIKTRCSEIYSLVEKIEHSKVIAEK
jgi:CheY-like chemotaxis protein